MKELKHKDEIITEVRAVREALAAEHGYDVDRLFATLQEREGISECEVRKPLPKRIPIQVVKSA